MNQPPFSYMPPMAPSNSCEQRIANIELILKEINEKLNILVKQKQNVYIQNDDNLYML